MCPKEIVSALSTEEKIKEAARTVFLKKGFASTRTRDIAEAAGENLALINYYFRSKENLYRIIMIETMGAFMNTMIPVFNDPHTALDEKIEQIVSNYIDLFKSRPDVPLFVVNEINSNAHNFMEQMDIRERMMGSTFIQQLSARMTGNPEISPMQIFISILGMTVFPFLASPLLRTIHQMSEEEFSAFMDQRKKLIPLWIKNIIDN